MEIKLTYELIKNEDGKEVGFYIYDERAKQPWVKVDEEFVPYAIKKEDGTWDYAKIAEKFIEEQLARFAEAEKKENQLDRIEKNTANLKAEIEQSAIDKYTEELSSQGLL